MTGYYNLGYTAGAKAAAEAAQAALDTVQAAAERYEMVARMSRVYAGEDEVLRVYKGDRMVANRWTNLVRPPSFETGSGTQAARTNLSRVYFDGSVLGGTYPVYIHVANTSYNIVNAQVHTGDRSLRVLKSAPGDVRIGFHTKNSTVVAGRTYTLSAYIYSDIAASARVSLNWGSNTTYPTNISISDGDLTAIPGAQWTRVSVTAVAPAGATNAFVSVTSNASYASSQGIFVDSVLLEESNTAGVYFDGSLPSPDSDLTASWLGTAYDSASVLTGVGVQNVAGSSSVWAVRSTQWYGTGESSMRVIPSSTQSTDTSVTIAGHYGSLSGQNVTFIPGMTYTVSATIRLTAPQTGSPHPRARGIYFYDTVKGFMNDPAQMATAPNEAGEYRLSLTFTVDPAATGATIRLYNGATAGNGDVWWDDLLLVEGVYEGPFFDGSNTPDGFSSAYWNGTPNASTSSWWGPALNPDFDLPSVGDLSFVPLGDGTYIVMAGNITDNGDGTFLVDGDNLDDNGDGTYDMT